MQDPCRRIASALLCCLISVPVPASAVTLVLEGSVVQGGLAVGRTDPGASVSFDGREVRVSDTGIFLVGFGRDAGPESTVVAVADDGTRAERRLEVKRRTYEIQRIDGLPPSKVTPPPARIARIRAEAALARRARQRDDERTDFLAGFVWPAVGRISGVYGSQRVLNGEPRRPHFGLDIAAPVGTPVAAPAAGVVTLAHPDMYFSGATLIIDHGHGLSSTFLHLDSIVVAEGEHVAQGQTIATIGASGRATGPHLDWRMNLFSARIDPALLVGPMPQK